MQKGSSGESGPRKDKGKEKDLRDEEEVLNSERMFTPVETSVPRYEELSKLISKAKTREVWTAEEEKEIENNLQFLKQLEQEESIKQKKAMKLEELEKTSFWQEARGHIETLKPSVVYQVQISFDQDNKLDPGARIKVRPSGKQHRHITPVMIVEKIMKAIFTEGKEFEVVFKELLGKIELFLGKSEEDGIQYVFDYHKLLEFKHNTRDIITLAKIVAHFYNKGAINTLIDEPEVSFY